MDRFARASEHLRIAVTSPVAVQLTQAETGALSTLRVARTVLNEDPNRLPVEDLPSTLVERLPSDRRVVNTELGRLSFDGWILTLLDSPPL